MSVTKDVHIVDCVQQMAADKIVVIDVIRGFTTAAAALNAGAARVLCVSTAADALAVARAHPGAMLAGEQAGLPPAGFELGNSPRDALAYCHAGSVVVLLTQNGTRALVRAKRAPTLVAAAAVNVSATAAWLRRQTQPGAVQIVCTDRVGEDHACAEHLAALLAGRSADELATASRVRAAADCHLAVWRRCHEPEACRAFRADADVCAAVDAYDFAMIGHERGMCVELVAEPPQDTDPVHEWTANA